MKKRVLAVGLLTTVLIFGGCATKEKETLSPKNVNKIFAKLSNNTLQVPGYKRVKPQQYIVMKNLTIKEAINKLNQIYGTNYFFEGENIILPSSNFKVYSPKDLKYYVEQTTKYNLYIEPNYNKDQIVKVRLVPKGVKSNYHFYVAGKSYLLDELFKLKNSNIQVIVDKGVTNKPITLAINTTNPNEFIKAVCEAGDVWCSLNSDRVLTVKKTKLLTVSLDKDGQLNFSIGKSATSNNTGATSTNTESGNSTTGGQTQSQQTTSSGGGQGFGYSVSNMSYIKLIKNISNMFGVTTYPGEDGYVQFDVTPSQYKKIKNYFTERDDRKELISAQINIYRIDLSDQFQYGINWNLFTSFLYKGVNGFDIAQNYKLLDPVTGSGGFLQIKNKILTEEIENYIKNNPDLSLDDIQQLRAKEYSGIIQALEQFGKVYKVDSYTNQFYTGEYIPFGNYQTIRYFTVGSTGGDNPEPTIEVNTENVGFQGSIIVNKTSNGYDVNGFLQQSAITGYTTMQTQYGEVKAPNTTAKNIRIKTHLSNLDRTIVIGGFKVKGITKNDNGTPVISDIPLFGYLFKNKSNLTQNSEFVVVIRLNKAEEGKINEKIK